MRESITIIHGKYRVSLSRAKKIFAPCIGIWYPQGLLFHINQLMQLKPYLQLGRLDKPIGIWLLWAPAAWALWIANQGHPDLKLVFLFFCGSIIMRTAGCVMNDLADRNIDSHVSRTATRPLAAGRLSLFQAVAFLAVLLTLALLILFQLPKESWYLAPVALAVVAVYPFCKRFFQAPQLVLGIAFSLAIPMAYKASVVAFDKTMFFLMLINLLWTIAYDTEYAMADKKEDLIIGIKSTAIWFGQYDKLLVGLFQASVQGLWLILGFALRLSVWFYLCWVLSGCILVYQHRLLAKNNSPDYMRAFFSNGWYGLLLWVGLIYL